MVITTNQRRLLESIGLERRARDISAFASDTSAAMPLRETLNAEVVLR
jgi:hypothetical protein